MLLAHPSWRLAAAVCRGRLLPSPSPWIPWTGRFFLLAAHPAARPGLAACCAVVGRFGGWLPLLLTACLIVGSLPCWDFHRYSSWFSQSYFEVTRIAGT